MAFKGPRMLFVKAGAYPAILGQNPPSPSIVQYAVCSLPPEVAACVPAVLRLCNGMCCKNVKYEEEDVAASVSAIV